MKNNNLLISLIVAAAIGGAAFLGGMKYQQSKQAATFAGGRGQFAARQGMGQGARTGGRGVIGEIISADTKTITLKLADGSSKIVVLSGTVMINKATAGTVADLTSGVKVSIFGTENSDGSVTAQNIQINPLLRVNPSVSPATTK